jgi:hypothetical protein
MVLPTAKKSTLIGILDCPRRYEKKRPYGFLQTLPSILSNSGFIIPDWLLKNTSLKLMASLVLFCNPGEEMRREPGKAFIPASNEHLQGLRRANQDFVACIQKRHPEREATLDADATLVETQKKEAFFSYRGI